MTEQYNFLSIGDGFVFDKDISDIDKYVVMTCVKNEEDYIVEWIEHYLNLGFDKLFIVDNNDVGNDSLIDTIKNYVERGVVQVFDCRGHNAVQVGIYADFCRESNFKWCAFYDCDEFLDIGAFTNIQSYLNQKCFEGYDVVLLNWLVFGPDGELKKKEGTVQERFKTPQSPLLYFKENSFVKSIVKGNKEKFKYCWFNGSHLPYNNDKNIKYTVAGYYEPSVIGHAYFLPRYKNGYIKHYYTKSFEEWIKKASRGWPDGTENLALSKYMIFRDNERPSIEFMKSAIFKVDSYNAYEQFKNELEAYDVVNIRSSGEFTYPMFTEFFDILEQTTGHTFIISDSIIDDTLYNIFLEYCYATGNRLVYCKDSNEIWMAYEKFHKKNVTYYIITFG